MFPAETVRHTLGRLAGILDRLGIRFHLAGLLADVLAESGEIGP